MGRSWGRLLARVAGYGFLVVLVLAALAITFTVGWRPVIGAKKRALTSRQFEVTPARLQRGDYLVHAVMHCMGCHTKYDRQQNPPVLASQEGSGQVLFEEGSLRIIAPNITSDRETGIGKWSEQDIVNLLKDGQTPDFDFVGGAMSAVVNDTAQLTDADRKAIAVFLKSVPAKPFGGKG